MPGLVHALGNAVFTVSGHAQVLGVGSSDVQRDRGAILRATDKARGLLEILVYLQDEAAPAGAPVQAGIVLQRLCEVLRVPLRQRGLGLRFVHSSTESPLHADGRTLCVAVGAALRRALEALPAGIDGALELDLTAQRRGRIVVATRVVSGPASLPFPVDLGPAAVELDAALRRQAVRVAVTGRGGELRVQIDQPALAPSEGEGEASA